MRRETKERREIARYAANILAVYLDCDETTRAAGAVWYAEERASLEDFARRHGLTLERAAGAAAAISPGMKWDAVQSYLAALLVNPRASVPTYSRAFVDRAVACLNGADPATVLSGPKVTAFYKLLAGVDFDAVVIDGHAINIARGEASGIRSMKGAGRVTAARYRRAVAAYREVAEVVGEAPHAVQAATWIHWRNLLDQSRKG